MRAILGHARVGTLGPTAGEGVQAVAEPEALPVGSGRFQHVVAADWLGRALNPDAAMRELARVLAHDGQCHVLCAGAAAPGEAGLTFSTAALQKLATRAGLVEAHALARRADGLPAETAGADITLLRAVRRVV
jgi:ubiquinone/menaquinone biosynthesis C-methylase UbiE